MYCILGYYNVYSSLSMNGHVGRLIKMPKKCCLHFPCQQSSSIKRSRSKNTNLTNSPGTVIIIDYVLTFWNLVNVKINVE